MAKVHVVRESFSFEGVDYLRGAEIADEELLNRIKEVHGHHLIQRHQDIPVPAKKTGKSAE